MNFKELAANVIVREQQINDINRSLNKLDHKYAADETAVRILEQARWNLCHEIMDLQVQMGGTR